MSLKNSNDTIGNRTRDLPVCSAVPQPLRHLFPHIYYIYLNIKNLYIAFFMLHKYKHLQNDTFASCLLNKHLLTLSLIFINVLPSVSYCNTVMLYAVFTFLFLVYCTKCASKYITERILICSQSR